MGAGVGLVDDGGLFMLDIDAEDELTAAAIEADAIGAFGAAPLRVGRWPKRALLYQCDVTLPSEATTFEGPGGKNNRVETIAKPKHLVVAGLHQATLRTYEWRRPIIPRVDLGRVTREQVDDFYARQRASKKPWICPAWRSIVRTRSTPAWVMRLATSFAEMEVAQGRALKERPSNGPIKRQPGRSPGQHRIAQEGAQSHTEQPGCLPDL